MLVVAFAAAAAFTANQYTNIELSTQATNSHNDITCMVLMTLDMRPAVHGAYTSSISINSSVSGASYETIVGTPGHLSLPNYNDALKYAGLVRNTTHCPAVDLDKKCKLKHNVGGAIGIGVGAFIGGVAVGAFAMWAGRPAPENTNRNGLL